ncbi:hypothetical protein CGZ80_08845 [Rhodopirellula sp. MGV]|nr:hypothetical protein CGZ80_08845 [Rhodopirellula sp. MGV]PNY36830.1 hypothetical protein C2E31_10750 [Rhodopirellula baltica]
MKLVESVSFVYAKNCNARDLLRKAGVLAKYLPQADPFVLVIRQNRPRPSINIDVVAAQAA